jgi:hypothetical protein
MDIGCIHVFVFLPFSFILIFVAEGLADMIKNETFRYQFLHFIWWIALLCWWFDCLVSIFLLAFSVRKTYNFFSFLLK